MTETETRNARGEPAEVCYQCGKRNTADLDATTRECHDCGTEYAVEGATTTPVWWCSWSFPLSLRDDTRIADSWPAGMKAWISAESSVHEIWCARVEAVDADAARALIRSCYGELANEIIERWPPIEKPVGWQPGDRFQ